MKINLWIGIGAVSLASVFWTDSGSFVFAKQSKARPAQEISLDVCSDEKLGIKILCQPDWLLVTNKQNFTMIIRDDDQESVGVTIERSDHKAGRLSDLTRPSLQFLGGYADFFKVESVTLGSLKALKVEGNFKESPDTQALDYYVIHNQHLYTVLFSCYPKKRFADYKELFEKMMIGFEFMK